MAKLAKILWYSFLSLLEYTILFVIAFAYLIRTETVQTYLAQKGAEYLTEYLGTPVSIDRVSITFIDRAVIDGLLVFDLHGDTLIYSGEMYVNLGKINLKENHFHLDELSLTNSVVKLKKYKGEEVLNLQFILDAFATDKTDKETTPFQLTAAAVSLENNRFVYHDQHQPHQEFGLDYAHLDLSSIALAASNVVVFNSSYAADILHLSAYDHSGFTLNEFKANARFDEKGAHTERLSIQAGKTKLNASLFDLQVDQLKDFSSFVDRVQFVLDLDSATAAMDDIAYFVPALKGMDVEVKIKGKIRESIAGLSLSDFQLHTGLNTMIEGDFVLPDFRIVDDEIWIEEIRYLYVDMADIGSIRLPETAAAEFVVLPDQVKRLGYVEGQGITLRGNTSDLVVSLFELKTELGNITFDENLRMTRDPNNVFFFTSNDPRKNYIHFNQFDLGKMLAVSDIGKIHGDFGFDAKLLAEKGLDIIGIHGRIARLDIAGYSYRNIFIPKARYTLDLSRKTPKSTIDGRIIIRDENLDLDYKGRLVLDDNFDFDVSIDILCAHLDQLHPTLKNRGELITQLKINGVGRNFNNFDGEIIMDSLTYTEGDQSFFMDDVLAHFHRDPKLDEFTLRSDFVDADIKGLIDFDKIIDNILYQSAQIFPSFFTDLKPTVDTNSYFNYTFNFKRINPALRIFVPDILVAKQTRLSGAYNGKANSFDLNLMGDYVEYQDYRFQGIRLFQELRREQLIALYDVRSIRKSDSLLLQDIHFTNIAANGFMDSHLIFHDKSNSKSNLEWYTQLFDLDGFDIDFLPSYFTINNHRWDSKEIAHINYHQDCFFIENFNLQRGDQSVIIDGQLSKLAEDHLNISIRNLDLEDFGYLFLDQLSINGVANVDGFIADPFDALQFEGTAAVKDLVIDSRQIGDMNFNANLDTPAEKIKLNGELIYLNTRTFDFYGDYAYRKEEDNIDFHLDFKNADIGVLNTFMDPDVVSGIRGKLYGGLHIGGTFKEPNIDGRIKINDGNVKVALLNTNFKFDGAVFADDMGFYIDNMPITDEEGNTGSLTGTVFHDNFSNFMYEVNVNLEEHPTMRNPLNRAEPMLVDRFLVMKTVYTEGSIYYGNAYVTGNVNISGFDEKMNINVNVATRRGTWIDFPMYGPTTLSEEGFISFKSPEVIEELIEDTGIDFSNVSMSLNFDVTTDARVKLIFDPTIGDEITATGSGKIRIGLDQYGDITMDGTYTLNDGVYNFVMGPYRQNFFIEKGGTIRWLGTPYNAVLDVRTFYRTITNMTVVMPETMTPTGSENEEIFSILSLQGDMNKPEISFDLAAPNASEGHKAILARIRSDEDELNRQFFSILIMKRFLPLRGQEGRGGSSGNAAYDLLSTQINSILSKVSDDYKMKVNLERDEMTGEESYEFGVSKAFLDNRLLVSGSFGLGVYDQGAGAQNQFIGDVNIEYLLDENGNFRINAFNISNDHSVTQHTQMGPFTQGVGISYKEDFHNVQDFQLIQAIFDLFRKTNNKKRNEKRKRRMVPLPPETNDTTKEE